MKTILASIAATAMAAGAASAFDYSTSFTTADGFMDGTINNQQSWSCFNNAHYILSDTAGLGIVGTTNTTGPVHGDTSADLTSELALGTTITMTLRFQFDGPLVNKNSGRWILGIGDAANTSLTPLVGGGVFSNDGTDFFLGDQGLSIASTEDTGTGLDADFHLLTTTITRTETSGEFSVDVSFDGGAVSNYTITNAGLWDGTTTAIAGFRWQGTATTGSVDSFSVSTPDGGGGDTVSIDSTVYETGTGVTITYTSAGPVDVYRNATGDLSAGNFTLLDSGEAGGTYVDETANASVNPNAFYVLVPTGELPFAP